MTVRIKDAAQPIGIVGRYQELVLEFAGSIENVDHIWAQDLLSAASEDITDKISVDGNRLTIPGALIERVGTSAGNEGDLSVPGMVLRLAGESLPVAGANYTPKVKIATAPETNVAHRQVQRLFRDSHNPEDPVGLHGGCSAGGEWTVLRTQKATAGNQQRQSNHHLEDEGCGFACCHAQWLPGLEQ